MNHFDFIDMPDIGKILKETREDLDLSQVKVMELTGINNKTLSGYENGVSEPDLRTLATLARLYNMSLDRIFFTSTDTARLDKNEILLLKYFRNLSSSEKVSLIIQAKALYENVDKKL